VLSHLIAASVALALGAGRAAPAADSAPPLRAAAAAPAPVTWRIDANHSELSFEIRHLVSRVRGSFKEWGGTVVADPADWRSGQVEVEIRTASVTTNHDRRDNDLRSSNFFAADSFPAITFRSTRVEMQGSDITIHGTLTMRGVSKPVVLAGEVVGTMPGPRGKRRAGFEASTTINRLDYGITWNRAVEGGGVLLGDEVKVTAVIAMVEQ
jgi:polyisoprenoid-binding protein YceI